MSSSDNQEQVDATIGGSIMSVAVNNLIEGIDGDCGGLSCATCHSYFGFMRSRRSQEHPSFVVFILYVDGELLGYMAGFVAIKRLLSVYMLACVVAMICFAATVGNLAVLRAFCSMI